jgi:HlyD family secretion protein
MGNGFGRRLAVRSAWVLLVLLLLGAAVWAVRQHRAAAAAGQETVLTCPVEEGPLVISVTQAGTIKPRETIVLKSQLEGRSTVLFLVPEGRQVEKGDLLVELDVTRLTDQRVEQEIRVRNAEASYIRVRENLEVVKNQARADVQKVELDLRFAQEDLRNYKDGEYPNQQTKLQGQIAYREEQLSRNAEKAKWSEQLFSEKYLSETELKADRLAAQQAALDLDSARNDLKLLEEYTYRRKIDQLTSDVAQAEMALERVRRKTSSDVIQAEADLAAREAEFNRQKDILAKLEEQIGKAKILAPADGLVVYASSTQFSWRGNTEPLAEGQEVHERQELIHLPTADTFMAAVKVHESSLKKIYPGLPVSVTVDALPGRTLMGKVAKIAPMPDPQSMFMNPDLKQFATEIHLEGGGDALRTGMTCAAEIVVARYETALYAPVQCVVRVGGTPTVYVMEGGTMVPRTVEIGLDNNRMVHLVSGVKAGERLVMTPPLASSTSIERPSPVGDVAIPPRPTQERRPGNGGPLPGAEAGAGAGAAAPAAPAAPGETAGPARESGRPNLSSEEMQRMRERFEKMTPEEQEAARRQWEGRRRQRDAQAPAPEAGPGAPRAPAPGAGPGAPPPPPTPTPPTP